MRQQLIMLLMGLGIGVPQAAAQTVLERPGFYTLQSMPMAEALDRVSRDFDVDFVYEEVLVANLHSSPIGRASTAYEALDAMLAGTALTFRFTSERAFTIERFAAESEHADMLLNRIDVAPRVDPSAYEWYGRLILREALAALRSQDDFANAAFEFRAYLWLSDDGHVDRVTIDGLESPEGLRASAATTLQGLQIRERPPFDMPQPIGLSIRAQ